MDDINSNKILFYPDSLPIIFSANNYFVPYMATAMQSIMENADKTRRYCFYVLYQDIDNDSMDLLRKEIAVFPQFTIEFINVTHYVKNYQFFTSRNITKEAYFRLLIPYLFSNYDKVIYLDGDMICRIDIACFFDINMKDYLLAAVRDRIISWAHMSNLTANRKLLGAVMLGMDNPDNYFNSGLILFNLELFRKKISFNEIFKLAQSREWQFHDQDILNVIAQGQSYLLSFQWNFMINDKIHLLPEELKNDYYKAFRTPKIIHYKPWNMVYHVPHFELFWKYAVRTPFIDIIIHRMDEKGYITAESYHEQILSNIRHRKNGLGLRFILFDCLKAWLSRSKPSNNLPKRT